MEESASSPVALTERQRLTLPVSRLIASVPPLVILAVTVPAEG
jgi:hypothetical protein